LAKDPKKRLGYYGPAEIKSHPFFSDIDFDQILLKKPPPPYKPILDSNEDTKHFDVEMTNIPLESPPAVSSSM
jgi:hypothetical protein